MRKIKEPFPEEEPANYNPAEPYADKAALVDHRNYVIGQYFIKEARAKILREKLEQCYMTHGVNHFEKCKDIKEKYMASTKGVALNWLNSSGD